MKSRSDSQLLGDLQAGIFCSLNYDIEKAVELIQFFQNLDAELKNSKTL